MVQVLIIASWVAIGGAVGFYEVRRGHWRGLWLLGAMAGPVAILLAQVANRNEPYVAPTMLEGPAEPVDRPGLNVLVGLDGSDDSLAASASIVRALGPQLGALTLATVVDYESMSDYHALSADDDRDRLAAEALLMDTVEQLEAELGLRPSAVVLAGKPATALEEHARQNRFDLLVIGRRGGGIAKRLLGSCAAELARTSSVPIVIVPADAAVSGRTGSDEAVTGS